MSIGLAYVRTDWAEHGVAASTIQTTALGLTFAITRSPRFPGARDIRPHATRKHPPRPLRRRIRGVHPPRLDRFGEDLHLSRAGQLQDLTTPPQPGHGL